MPFGLDEPYRVLISEDPIEFAGGDVNLYNYVGNNPVNFVDPLGLYIGQYPPAPPGYDPTTWQQGQWANGKWYVKSPDGRVYTVHPEDKGHWRHWDIRGPGGKDDGSWPPNGGKGRQGQKKLKNKQCDKDPSGNAPEWQPYWIVSPEEYQPELVPFMPLDPFPVRVPIRIPIRIPIPVW